MILRNLKFFPRISAQLTRECLQLINAERNNKVIDTQLISQVIQIYSKHRINFL